MSINFVKFQLVKFHVKKKLNFYFRMKIDIIAHPENILCSNNLPLLVFYKGPKNISKQLFCRCLQIKVFLSNQFDFLDVHSGWYTLRDSKTDENRIFDFL